MKTGWGNPKKQATLELDTACFMQPHEKSFLLHCYYTGSWFYLLKPSDLGLFYAYWLLFYYFPRDCTPLSQMCSLVRINSSI